MRNYKSQKLRKFSEPVSTNENESYKIGYIAGSIEGDGHVGYYRYPNKSTIYRVGLGVTDKGFRDVVHSYFKEIGLSPILYERQSKYYPNSKKTYITESHRKSDYYKVLKILKNKDFNDKDFCRGYLAAIFDSEGEFDRWNLRISNKSQSVLDNVKNILRRFNFKWSEYNRKDGLVYIKILGGLNEHTRFFSFFRPKITRKRPKMETREVKGELVKIISINKIPDEKVYNLEIEKTSTYIANGFLCHNTYVDDVIEANILAMKKNEVGVFNIGTAKETSINTIFRQLKKLTGSDCKKIHGSAKKGDVKKSCLDFSKAEKSLSWEPQYSLEQGLRETVNWFKKYYEKH